MQKPVAIVHFLYTVYGIAGLYVNDQVFHVADPDDNANRHQDQCTVNLFHLWPQYKDDVTQAGCLYIHSSWVSALMKFLKM